MFQKYRRKNHVISMHPPLIFNKCQQIIIFFSTVAIFEGYFVFLTSCQFSSYFPRVGSSRSSLPAELPGKPLHYNQHLINHKVLQESPFFIRLQSLTYFQPHSHRPTTLSVLICTTLSVICFPCNGLFNRSSSNNPSPMCCQRDLFRF